MADPTQPLSRANWQASGSPQGTYESYRASILPPGTPGAPGTPEGSPVPTNGSLTNTLPSLPTDPTANNGNLLPSFPNVNNVTSPQVAASLKDAMTFAANQANQSGQLPALNQRFQQLGMSGLDAPISANTFSQIVSGFDQTRHNDVSQVLNTEQNAITAAVQQRQFDLQQKQMDLQNFQFGIQNGALTGMNPDQLRTMESKYSMPVGTLSAIKDYQSLQADALKTKNSDLHAQSQASIDKIMSDITLQNANVLKTNLSNMGGSPIYVRPQTLAYGAKSPNPIDNVKLANGMVGHPGIDIPGNIGDPIQATVNGTVVSSGINGEYGLQVQVRDQLGDTHYYSHMSGSNVKVGDVVSKGQLLGGMGQSGFATGPHLDYRIKNTDGQWIDPNPYAQGMAAVNQLPPVYNKALTLFKGSAADRDFAKTALTNLLQTGDTQGAQGLVRDMYIKGMNQIDLTQWNANQKVMDMAPGVSKLIAYKMAQPGGLDTGLLKKMQTVLGGQWGKVSTDQAVGAWSTLTQDQDYIQIAAELMNVEGEVQHARFGSRLTDPEIALSGNYLPNMANDQPLTLLTKLEVQRELSYRDSVRQLNEGIGNTTNKLDPTFYGTSIDTSGLDTFMNGGKPVGLANVNAVQSAMDSVTKTSNPNDQIP